MSPGPAQPGSTRYCGRLFTPAELDHIRHLTATLPTRRAIADAACHALGWVRPDGRPKDMTARVALLRMHNDGLITLPAPRNSNGNGRHPRHLDAQPALLPTPGQQLGPTTLAGLGPVRLTVVSTPADSRTYNTLIATHHYLGYTPLAGAQLRYLAHAGTTLIGALGFAAAAWACAPRDRHIGWNPTTRQQHLHLVAGNARFLIHPDLRVPNLASTLLASVARQLPADWHHRYGYSPVLLETFVETSRFTGASYRAANWIHVGHTQGRGKLDRHHHHALPVKDIYLYPLHRHYRRILTTPI